MLRRSREPRDDAGFTLIEVLIALAILGVAVTALTAALSSLTLLTERHRGLSGTDTVVRDYSEAIKQEAIQNSFSGGIKYPECPTAAQLTPTYSASGFSTTIDKVEYWVPNVGDPQHGSFTTDRPTCTNSYAAICGSDTRPECDPGVLRLTLTAKATAGELRGGQTTTQILIRRSN